MTDEQQTIFVDAKLVNSGNSEYVCWIDLMGTRSIMGQSLERAANFICRLHVAILESMDDSTQVYPMIDGSYITAPSKQSMLNFLRKVFKRLANEFILAKEHQHRFLPKAAVSYGPVFHGKAITQQVNKVLYEDKRIRDSLLFGIPVIAASQGERNAPPFGIFVDQSARIFAPTPVKPLPFVWYRWFNTNDPLREQLKETLGTYFDWCAKHSYTLTYPPERIKEHKAMAIEYFS
jgi:hypothetical protein